MLDAILQEYQTSTYQFRHIANPDDPLAAKFTEWEDYYRLKWAIARTLQPQSILEIGVRYGYSAHAFLDAMPQSQYLGIDLDCEMAGGVKGAINWARKILAPFAARVLVADSQAMSQFPGDRYDLIHVDGQQDGDSSFHDLSLAIQQGDYVLVDGYHWSTPNFLAVNDFLLQHRQQLAWYASIPGYAGELLIKPKPTARPAAVQTSQDLQATYDKTYYTQSCHGYDSFTRYQGQRLEDERLIGAATLACLKPQGHVLDLGCGRGELTIHLAQQGYRVTAIDYSATAIELAQACLSQQPDLQSLVELHCADVNQVNLPAASYDLVIATDLIEHLNPSEVVSLYNRINRWLKSEGLFIVHTFPNRWYYQYDYARKRRLAKRLGAYLPQNPRTEYERLMHINEQSPRALKRQLKDAFRHHQLWFATAGPQGLGGSLTQSLTHRELAAAPSLYAIASAQPLPALHPLLTTQPIRWLRSQQLRQRFTLEIVHAPDTVPAAQPFEIQVRLTNHSQQILHSLGAYPINWSYRWVDRQGDAIIASGDRTRLFPPSLPIDPGSNTTAPTATTSKRSRATAPYHVRIVAPDQHGEYCLQVTLVQEQIRWFDQPPIGLKQTRCISITANNSR
ncbi:methyltransferase domain-containing protein [filamentous cyanobacterium LEGE 11480]|uniref:Methyltransferase domain-containing protein n=1 Tax=Romeriopsis navalis LEGE 11480 TaxID=2777977 RepID=A0A928VV78_9CYAN|nr:methyltransferase domain-containing protein [Romeriopsis navalis]MBE9032834.1 methyltransferase domain-containing protein [Romeriopsis navalis LEGE 11480]